jgi:hypothetical protein
LAVEGEADGAGAVDPATGRQAMGAHEVASRLAWLASSGGCSPIR